MLNSQNYATSEKVIRTGEVVAGMIPGAPGTKTYYHQVPMASTYMPDGAQVVFSGGQYTTDNKDIMAHLDAIVDRVGSLVYSRRPGSPITKEEADVAIEVSQPAGNASNTGAVKATPQQAGQLANQVAANKPTAANAVNPAVLDK